MHKDLMKNSLDNYNIFSLLNVLLWAFVLPIEKNKLLVILICITAKRQFFSNFGALIHSVMDT